MQKTDARHSAGAGESKLHFLDYWRVIRVRFGIVLLSFLLVVITAAVVTYFLPRKYRSSTLMEVRSPEADMGVFHGDVKASPMMNLQFLPTQTEIIKSHEVLDPVVTSQDLTRAWGTDGVPLPREAAVSRLASMLELKQIRSTELLELDVTSTKPEEAQKLVTAVADSYKTTRRARVLDPANDVDQKAGEQIAAGRKVVQDLEAKMIDFRRLHPEVLVDGYVDSKNGSTEDPYASEVRERQASVDKVANGVTGLTSQLEKISGLKGDELMRALATLQIKDPTVETVLPKYQEANSTEALMLNSGLGQNHPKLKSLRAAREVYMRQLTEQIDSIRHSLEIQLGIQKDLLVSVTKSLADLRSTQRGNRSATEDYRGMSDEYNRQKSLVDAAELTQKQRMMDAHLPITPVIILNQAQLPLSPSSPRVPLNMAIGVLLGIIVGVGLAFFIEYLDTSVKTMDDVETMLGVPVLAIVPKNIKLLHKQPTDVPDAEAYRILRTNIEFNRKSADANTISMVSGGPGEGKSTTLCNLAFTCAQGGYSVLIVDADLRRPTQHKLFEVNNSIGLTNYLTTNIALEDVILSTPVDNLSLMPSGILPADAVGILNSQRMSDMIAELKARYDIIFFDSPPILGVSDGAVLASEVDQSIIIVQHRRFPRAMLLRVKQAIQNVGGTVLGVVLNNVDLRHDPNYAYYTSYYEYYAVRTPKEMPEATGTSGAKAKPVAAGGKVGASSSDY